jgi:hypothetical protein
MAYFCSTTALEAALYGSSIPSPPKRASMKENLIISFIKNSNNNNSYFKSWLQFDFDHGVFIWFSR